MGKNTKPMLTVLMDGDRLQGLRDYAASKEVSMGWLVNRMVERVLSGEFDVMGDNPSVLSHLHGRETRPQCAATSPLDSSSVAISTESIDKMVRASLEKHLEDISGFLPIESIEQMAIGAIDKHLEGLNIGAIDKTEGISTEVIEGMVKASIEVAIEPLENGMNELESFTKSQLEAVRAELKKPAGVR